MNTAVEGQLNARSRTFSLMCHKGSPQGKKRAFRLRSKEDLKALQKELRRRIREGKNSYKMEDQLQQSSGEARRPSLDTRILTSRLWGPRPG